MASPFGYTREERGEEMIGERENLTSTEHGSRIRDEPPPDGNQEERYRLPTAAR